MFKRNTEQQNGLGQRGVSLDVILEPSTRAQYVTITNDELLAKCRASKVLHAKQPNAPSNDFVPRRG